MDYLDVVVHIFTPETREFYRLEQLWGEAPARVAEQEPGPRERHRTWGLFSGSWALDPAGSGER